MTQSKKVLKWTRIYSKDKPIGWFAYYNSLCGFELKIFDDTPDTIYVDGVMFKIDKYFNIESIF